LVEREREKIKRDTETERGKERNKEGETERGRERRKEKDKGTALVKKRGSEIERGR